LVDDIEISLSTESNKDKSADCSYTNDNCGDRNNDSTPLHPLSTVIVSVGEEQGTKLNNDKFFEHNKSNGLLFVSRRTRSYGYEILPFIE
jgi:hypothetical protein